MQRFAHSLAASAVAVAALAAASLAPIAAAAEDAATADSDQIEEIILVTARKRSESIQDVPVAVTALTAEQIADFGVRDLADVSKVTAGLIFDSEYARGSNRPVIRGQANILGDSGVSYFIDGVYAAGPIDDYDLSTVERIEVVKGPQSALYGRNTYSGAINVVTRRAAEAMGGEVTVEAAQDDQYLVRGALSGPLSDVFAGGVNVRHYERGGPFTNAYDGSEIGSQESQSVAAFLEFEPSERVFIRGRAYVGRRDDGQPPVTATRYLDNNCFLDDGSLYGGAGRYYCGVVEPRPINTDWTVQVPEMEDSDDNAQLSLRVDVDLSDAVTLTSITGSQDRTSRFVIDGDYLPTSFQVSNFTPNGFPFGGFADGPPFLYAYVGSMTDFTFASEDVVEGFSQEFQIAFDTETVRGLIGAYYYSEDGTSRDIREVSAAQRGLAAANFGRELGRMQGVCAASFLCESMTPFFGPTIDVPRDVNAIEVTNTAVFGMVSFDMGEQLGLTLEGRFQDEEISQRAVIQNLGSPAEPPVEAEAAFDGFLPRITLDWRPADDSLVYLLHASGTKPGGFNSTVAIEAGIPTYDEEEAKSFEIGYKTVLAGGRITANLAAFMNQVEGYQLTQNVRAGQNATSATVNAGDADITGFEAEITAMPATMPGLTLRLNYAWTDPEFTRGVDQNEGLLLDVADDGLTNCSTGKQFAEVEDCTGNARFGSIVGRQVPRTANHQLFADVELRRALANGWAWYAGVNYAHESSKFAQVHNQAETGGATLVNVRLGAVTERLAIRLWARNVTGEDTPYNVLRYAEPEAFRRNFAIAHRRDTHVGLTVSTRW